MSQKEKSISSKTDFNQDERLQKVSKLRLLLNRPELGALGGALNKAKVATQSFGAALKATGIGLIVSLYPPHNQTHYSH